MCVFFAGAGAVFFLGQTRGPSSPASASPSAYSEAAFLSFCIYSTLRQCSAVEMMKVWVADELGQIKCCTIEKQGAEDGALVSDVNAVSSPEDHDRGDYVQIMTLVKWQSQSQTMTGVAVARRGGVLQIIDPSTSRTLWNRLDERVDADDMFVALEGTNGYLFWCTNAGCFGFSRLAPNIESEPSADLVRLNRSSELVWDLGKHGPISRARCHPRFVGVFALGGKEVDLEIWSSKPPESGKHLKSFRLSWCAKNVANDEFNLKQPVWISDLCFLDEQCNPQDGGYLIACCTRFHQVRVYNTLESRRPILNVDVGTSPLVSIVLGRDDSEVIVADSHGSVISFSLSKKCINGHFGDRSGKSRPTGNILAVDVYNRTSSNGMLACVGLDRFLSLYDLSTLASIGRVFCKTKMTSVIFIDGTLEEPSSGATHPTSKRKKGNETKLRKVEKGGNDSFWPKLADVSSVESSDVKRRRVHA